MEAEFFHLLLDRIEELEARLASLEAGSGLPVPLDDLKMERLKKEELRRHEIAKIRERVAKNEWTIY